MTELEFQRAGRGDSDHPYPWGEAWDDKKFCHSLHVGKDVSAAVGSYPEGAVNGIHDLAGNVWEWSASPFNAYPGYKALKFKAQKRVIECLAPFDPDQRVTVSGSFQNDKLGVRLATRRPTDRDQATGALGFRCAASALSEGKQSGHDMARWTLDRTLKLAVLNDQGELAPERAIALRRWTTGTGQVKVPGYALITGYEQVLACPIENVKALTVSDVATMTQKGGPLFVGFVEIPRPLKQPEIDAGTYFVAWRGAAKLEEQKPAAAAVKEEGAEPVTPLDQIPGFVAESDCYILYSADGTPQVAFPAPPLTTDKAGNSSLVLEPYVAPDPQTLPKDAPPPTPLDTLRVKFVLQSASSKAKAIVFDVPFKLAPGALDSSFK
jgi:hypothetical protein